MPTRKSRDARNLRGNDLVKEVNRRIRVARSLWDAHRNDGCRRERLRALELYERLSETERRQVPEALRTWLRYRSEKYFGEGRRGNGANSRG